MILCKAVFSFHYDWWRHFPQLNSLVNAYCNIYSGQFHPYCSGLYIYVQNMNIFQEKSTGLWWKSMIYQLLGPNGKFIMNYIITLAYIVTTSETLYCVMKKNPRHDFWLLAIMILVLFKMLYLIGPDGRINRRFINFPKMVWMTMIRVLRFRIKHQNLGMHIYIHAVFWKFAYTFLQRSWQLANEESQKVDLILRSDYWHPRQYSKSQKNQFMVGKDIWHVFRKWIL